MALRDGDPKRYLGKGVQKAVANVNGEIAETVGVEAALDAVNHIAEVRQEEMRRLRGNRVLIGITATDGQHALQGRAVRTHHLIKSVPGHHTQRFAAIKMLMRFGNVEAGQSQ